MSHYFRKLPGVIQAFQMTKERRMDNSEWPDWLNEAWQKEEQEPGSLHRYDNSEPLPDELEITTLEGLHRVTFGDFIIRSVKGELYPCKEDIFKSTYEPVDNA